MDRKIYDLLLEMQKENREMKDAISTIVNTQEIMHQSLQKMQQEQAEMKQEMNKRFDSVESRIEAVENKFDNLGEMFERNVNIQVNDDSIMNKLRYLSHKVSEYDEAIFHLKNKK